MSNIPSIGARTAVTSIQEPSAQEVKQEKPEASSTQTSKQDAKEKVGEMKLEGQVREAQLRSQLDVPPDWKMPGVEVNGPPIEDPKIEQGFKAFDKPMPSVDMKWPENGEWKSTTEKDGTVRREMTDANGTQWKERIDQKGTRDREMIVKDGNRKMEISDSSGYVLRGGADNKGNSWSFDSKGVSVRMHSDESGKSFAETRFADGSRSRQMNDLKGNYWNEKIQDGKVEQDRGDANGNRQMLLKEPSGFSIRGFSDNKGNSYSVDSKGTQTRMHTDQKGNTFSESSFQDGSRTRQVYDKKGNIWIESKDIYGNIERRKEKINGGG
jgi:hypothetical protein